MIKLKDLIKGLDCRAGSGAGEVCINGITTDSRFVKKGDLFCAIRGMTSDGHDYIREALGRGAGAVLSEKRFNRKGAASVRARDTRAVLPFLASRFYGEPSKALRVIGITGTNGKTTTSYLAEGVLKAASFKAGLIGTITYKVRNKKIEPENTTPSPVIVQGLMRDMADSGLGYCVMEVSSHALEQRRTDCVDFDVAVFTNATPEHLDYHKTFKRYLAAKQKLFRNMKPSGACIINRDDPGYRSVKKACGSGRIITYGLTRGADVCARDIKLSPDGSDFTICAAGGKAPVKSGLIGSHNIYNMLAAASCGISEGISTEKIAEGLESVKAVEGRMQPLHTRLGFKVFIDYAHTDDALDKALNSLSGFKKRRMITVFGCGGQRDKTKRPRMGRVAARFSDKIFITSDNPRMEDQKAIADDVTRGLKNVSADYEVILDRHDAIKEAISSARKGDIVLIAGKGHEKYQVIGEEKIPFCDLTTAREFIRMRECSE